jgi:hypothetical protein
MADREQMADLSEADQLRVSSARAPIQVQSVPRKLEPGHYVRKWLTILVAAGLLAAGYPYVAIVVMLAGIWTAIVESRA